MAAKPLGKFGSKSTTENAAASTERPRKASKKTRDTLLWKRWIAFGCTSRIRTLRSSSLTGKCFFLSKSAFISRYPNERKTEYSEEES